MTQFLLDRKWCRVIKSRKEKMFTGCMLLKFTQSETRAAFKLRDLKKDPCNFYSTFFSLRRRQRRFHGKNCMSADRKRKCTRITIKDTKKHKNQHGKRSTLERQTKQNQEKRKNKKIRTKMES